MNYEITEPAVDERGEERHPSFGLARVNRHSVTPGATLFDSDIRHPTTVVLTVSTASRERHLKRDWIHAEKTLLEIEMSEAQWGALVSSFGNGEGVPVTITRTETEPRVPSAPFEPRMQVSIEETRKAADDAAEAIREAFEAVKAKPTKANLRTLEARIDNMAPNVAYAAKSLTEHAENVITKAKADIEAMMVGKAAEMGLTAADLPTFALGSAEDPDVVDAEVLEDDGAPCCPDSGCGGNPCTFPGYADNH